VLKLLMLVALGWLAVAQPSLAQPASGQPEDESAAEATDTAAADAPDAWGLNWIPPSGFYKGWVFLLQGYYSGLDGFGAGLDLSRPFTVPVLTDYLGTDIEFSASGRVYEQLHGQLEIRTEATIGEGRWNPRAVLQSSTRLREFWGVGSDVPDINKELFRPRDLRMYLELLRRFGRLGVGFRVEWQDYQYLETESGGLLESGEFSGVSAGGKTVFGYGLTFDLDHRNDLYNPSAGWWFQGYVMSFGHFDDGGADFGNMYLDGRAYWGVTSDDVLAFQAFFFGVQDSAPVWRLASLGGREHSRGYSRNRYLEKRMAALQVEWRRPLFWRLHMQLFTGTAVVTARWKKMQLKDQRPTFGAGLSVQVPEVSSVALRGDLATGGGSVHGTLSIGYAF